MNFQTLSWNNASEKLEIKSGEVHIFYSWLDLEEPHLNILYDLLSEDERKRADSFGFKKHRRHFIAARGMLRKILSLYLNIYPSNLRFDYNPFGKPIISDDIGGEVLSFNLSHSRGLAYFGITCNKEIGVDVEFIRSDIAYEKLAKRFFSTGENIRLKKTSPDLRLEAFFNCWTLKEAYIKAKGRGLSLPLKHFEVSFLPEEPAGLLCVNGDPQEPSRWHLLHLPASPGYAAALAVKGGQSKLKYWQWKENRNINFK